MNKTPSYEVLQGSVVGPLLSLLYGNNNHNAMERAAEYFLQMTLLIVYMYGKYWNDITRG